MDRRESLKSIVLGTVAGGLALHGCKPENVASESEALQEAAELYGRTKKEKERDAELNADQFFNEHELETIGILSALILPANDKFPSAKDVGVPEFIEFVVKDMPHYQTPIRGGLMWLDHTSNTRFEEEFKSITEDQQKEILDEIAYPDITKPQGEWPLEERFFLNMRNITLTGYYTTKTGIEDLGYKGNQFNVWDGVPNDVLEQHGMAYEPEWLAKCVDQSKRNDVAQWDDDGNLIT
ncbi:gluconate 2-dehydrogenase subunit 3 family protein [Flavobacteriaceae sp. LMIT009]